MLKHPNTNSNILKWQIKFFNKELLTYVSMLSSAKQQERYKAKWKVPVMAVGSFVTIFCAFGQEIVDTINAWKLKYNYQNKAIQFHSRNKLWKDNLSF